MHKQITLSLILISSFSFAYEISKARLESIKQLAQKQEAFEKHFAEKNKAINDLKKAGITIVATIAASFFVQSYLVPENLPTYRETILIGGRPIFDTGKFTAADVILRTAEYAGLFYSIYKGYQGAKHLIAPNHPKPEQPTPKEENHHA